MSTLSRVIYDPDITAPSVPTGLTATVVGTSRIDLSWNPSTDPGGSGVAGYDIIKNGSSTLFLGVQTSYSDTGLSAGSTHQYRVRARDVAGNTSAYGNQASATTQSSSNPGSPLFSDSFNYTIARTATPTQLQAGFRAAGWNDARAENGTGRDTSYLYTVNSIAGFGGTFPAGARCLAMEGYPNNGNDPSFLQSDYWVQYGNESTGSLGDVPANFWCQFWIYLQNFGTQLSRYPNRNKFLYPVADFFPGSSTPPNVTAPWLVLLGAQAYEEAFGPLADNYIGVQAFGSNRGDGSDRLYQNVSTKRLVANQWHLVKLHIDTSQADGTVECWFRTQGEASFTKVMDWRNGVTPGYSWTTYASTRSGMKLLRMPTTENANPVNNPLRNGDGTNFKFMQAFALANSEAALPTY